MLSLLFLISYAPSTVLWSSSAQMNLAFRVKGLSRVKGGSKVIEKLLSNPDDIECRVHNGPLNSVHRVQITHGSKKSVWYKKKSHTLKLMLQSDPNALFRANEFELKKWNEYYGRFEPTLAIAFQKEGQMYFPEVEGVIMGMKSYAGEDVKAMKAVVEQGYWHGDLLGNAANFVTRPDGKILAIDCGELSPLTPNQSQDLLVFVRDLETSYDVASLDKQPLMRAYDKISHEWKQYYDTQRKAIEFAITLKMRIDRLSREKNQTGLIPFSQSDVEEALAYDGDHVALSDAEWNNVILPQAISGAIVKAQTIYFIQQIQIKKGLQVDLEHYDSFDDAPLDFLVSKLEQMTHELFPDSSEPVMEQLRLKIISDESDPAIQRLIDQHRTHSQRRQMAKGTSSGKKPFRLFSRQR